MQFSIKKSLSRLCTYSTLCKSNIFELRRKLDWMLEPIKAISRKKERGENHDLKRLVFKVHRIDCLLPIHKIQISHISLYTTDKQLHIQHQQ